MSGSQVSYEEAIATLTAMFPAIETGVIEAVLELNRGAMEPTVEQLLGMDPNSAPAAAAPSPPPQSVPATGQVRQQTQHPTIGVGVPVPETYQTTMSSGRRQRVQLAPDFLVLPPDVVAVAATYGAGLAPERIPGAAGSAAGRTAGPGRGGPVPTAGAAPGGAVGPAVGPGGRPLTQMEQDELMAQMLQNEVFLEQLASDPEFVAYLRANPDAAVALGLPVPPPLQPHGSRGQGAHGSQRADRVASVRSSGAAASGAGSGGQAVGPRPGPAPGAITGFGNAPLQQAGSSGNVMSALSSMGSDMRRRFDTMAARFRRGQSGAPSSGVPWATSGAGNAGAGNTAASSFGTRITSMFDGRGQYATLDGRQADDEGAELVPMTHDRLDRFTDSPGPSGAGQGQGSSRADRVSKINSGTSPAPASFGKSPATGPRPSSAGGLGVTGSPAGPGGSAYPSLHGHDEGGLVEIDFSLNDFAPTSVGATCGTAPAGVAGGSSGAGGTGKAGAIASAIGALSPFGTSSATGGRASGGFAASSASGFHALSAPGAGPAHARIGGNGSAAAVPGAGSDAFAITDDDEDEGDRAALSQSFGKARHV